MRCPSCMAENAARRRLCAQCGGVLPVPCTVCGFENEIAARSCGGCGRPIGEIAAQKPATPSALSRADSGLWVGHLTRGEPTPAREMVELFLREAAARPNSPEVVIAHRLSGQTSFYFGDSAGAPAR